MATETKKEIQLEIAHVLFIDIIGYSKLSINEQHAAVDDLTQIVRGTGEFKKADDSQRLIKIATGDGMALVFYNTLEAPVRCAIEVTRTLKDNPRLRVRMGIHSGPVSGVIDVNERTNLAGAGLNLAQRVMDCGDADHILLSKHVAEDLGEFEEWRPLLHNLGACEVKHGTEISVVNLYGSDFGNRDLPATFRLIKRRSIRRRNTVVAATLIAGAVITAAGIWFSRTRMAPTLGAPEKSIAVLPFENLSDDKSTAYFSDGITEEILNALAQIPKLKVAARRSAFQFKGADLDLHKIGQTLGVAHILEGSLQKAGEQVRINVQLVDVNNGSQTWSEKYDRKLDNVFAVEDEIAKAIATRLRVQLTGGAGQPLVVDSTNNPQAHELYLRGLTLLAARGPALREAKELFQQAVKIDSSYAQAWGALGITELLLPSYALDSFDAALPRGEAAAQRALSLDPNNASGYIAVGMLNSTRARWSEADQAFRRALALAPGNAEVVNQYAQFLSAVGQLEPALHEIERAQQLDPLSPIIGVIHAGALDGLRRAEAATAQIKGVLDAHPEFAAAHYWAAAQFIERRMYPEAEARLRSSATLNGRNGDSKALLIRGIADPAQRAVAVTTLETSPDNADIRQDPILYAFYLVSLGERDRALNQLEIYGAKPTSAFSPWLWNPGFDPLRDDPRFKAVLARLGLPYAPPPALTEP